uniref:Uncharacterized protein n=1 Tax=Lepeophtheirus salmonis TaxID=72036 RepID=A0A0K2V581_LEPSM
MDKIHIFGAEIEPIGNISQIVSISYIPIHELKRIKIM